MKIMEKTVKKHHFFRTILSIFLSIIIIILALPFIYSLVGGFHDYDKIHKLASSDKVVPVTVDEDGIVSFSADKSVVYSYASKVQFEEMFYELIQEEFPFVTEKTVRVAKLGYSIDENSLSASVKLRLFGIVPLQLHVYADFKLSKDEVMLKLNELKYGKWITIPIEELAETYGIPVLVEKNIYDISDFYGELYPIDVNVKDDVIHIKCNIINRTIRNTGGSSAAIANVVPTLLEEDSVAVKLLRGKTSEIYNEITDSTVLSKLFSEILNLTPEKTAEELKQLLEDTPFINIKIEYEQDIYSGYSEQLCEKLGELETNLTTLRDNYKEKKYMITENGLSTSDGLPAESALPEEWNAKIVLQYNQDYESIVKASDGIQSKSTGEWIELPNPSITDLKHTVSFTMPPVKVLDLTVAFRLEDGTPAVLFLTASDELGINIISEELYNEIVSQKGLVVYSATDIISGNFYFYETPVENLRNLSVYVPDQS